MPQDNPAGGPEDRVAHLCVLLVDDSDTMRQLVEGKVAEVSDGTYPLLVDHARSGEEALELARERHYDLIILDVEMPGMGGLEACRHLRDITPARLVILSSRIAAEDHQAGREAGCRNYLGKPPNEVDLRVILRLVQIAKTTQ